MSNLTQFTKKLAKLITVNFTTSGSFTVPQGVTTIFVTMIAGGGGYAREGYYDKYSYIGAGGGGYYLNEPISVTPGNTLTVTVAAGGSSGYRYLNANGTATVWYGTATSGGNSSIYDGATKLIQTIGGSSGTDITYTGYATGYGNGGWPNGAGGGALGTARSGSTGVGGVDSLGISSAYSQGADSNATAGAGAVGMGEYPGAEYYAGGSPIPGGYGVGADISGTYNQNTRTPGANGFVQISYYEV
jgi:hypothetical protein